MAGYGLEVHHAISVLINHSMHTLGRGSDPSRVIRLVDEIEMNFPGDEKQTKFYVSVRGLARKICCGSGED